VVIDRHLHSLVLEKLEATLPSRWDKLHTEDGQLEPDPLAEIEAEILGKLGVFQNAVARAFVRDRANGGLPWLHPGSIDRPHPAPPGRDPRRPRPRVRPLPRALRRAVEEPPQSRPQPGRARPRAPPDLRDRAPPERPPQLPPRLPRALRRAPPLRLLRQHDRR